MTNLFCFGIESSHKKTNGMRPLPQPQSKVNLKTHSETSERRLRTTKFRFKSWRNEQNFVTTVFVYPMDADCFRFYWSFFISELDNMSLRIFWCAGCCNFFFIVVFPTTVFEFASNDLHASFAFRSVRGYKKLGTNIIGKLKVSTLTNFVWCGSFELSFMKI